MASDLSTEVCLFHGDRHRFDKVVRDIQRAGIIPRPHVYRLHMAVCSCKQTKPVINDLLEAAGISLQSVTDMVKQVIKNSEKWSSFLVEYLKGILNKNVCLNDHSVCIFLYILHQAAVLRKFDLLENDGHSHKQNINLLKKKATSTKKPKNLTQEQYDLIIRKKMKKMKFHEKGILPLYPGNLKKVRDSEGYKRLINIYKSDIVLRFDAEANGQAFDEKKSVTHVVYHYDDEHKLKEFKISLHHCAKTRQEIEDKAHMMRRDIRRSRPIRSHHWKHQDDGIYQDNTADRLKESKTTDYDKKHHKERKSGHGQKKTIFTTLSGGHCLHCMKPFSRACLTAECKHHPGFIKYDVKCGGYIWTCCAELTEQDKPTHEEHASSGCCSELHLWRKKKTIGSRKQEGYAYQNKADMYRVCRMCVLPWKKNSRRDVYEHLENAWF